MPARFEGSVVSSFLFLVGVIQPHLRGGLAPAGDGQLWCDHRDGLDCVVRVHGWFGCRELGGGASQFSEPPAVGGYFAPILCRRGTCNCFVRSGRAFLASVRPGNAVEIRHGH